jgi:hypothetical protein
VDSEDLVRCVGVADGEGSEYDVGVVGVVVVSVTSGYKDGEVYDNGMNARWGGDVGIEGDVVEAFCTVWLVMATVKIVSCGMLQQNPRY